MINLEYIIFFSFIAAILIYMLWFWERLGNDHFGKMAAKAILKKASRQNNEIFFCEPVLRRVVSLLRHRRKAKKALVYLTVGRITLAQNYLRQKGYKLEALLLRAHLFPRETISSLEEYIRENPQDQTALGALAELYFVTGNNGLGQLVLDKINLSKASLYVRGIYWYYQTGFYLKDGDMLAASQSCARAEKYFLQEKAFYAAARSYLLMGTVYRLCFIEDVASFMFRSALKIYQQLNYVPGQAAAYGNLGMLSSASEHFDEAQSYFEQARELYKHNNLPQGVAEIDNQLGLLNILNRDYASAEVFLQKALLRHRELSSVPGLAFNAELRSYLASARKNYELSLQTASEAAGLYLELDNYSAYLESLYLQAEALCASQRDSAAEQALRRIIEFSREHPSSFHIANAYSLLGLIFMRRGELQRAKGLFQQSLEQEQRNDRWSGQASDYANIGLLELRCGQTDQAQKHLQAALDLAISLGDNNMAAYLKQKLAGLKT